MAGIVESHGAEFTGGDFGPIEFTGDRSRSELRVAGPDRRSVLLQDIDAQARKIPRHGRRVARGLFPKSLVGLPIRRGVKVAVEEIDAHAHARNIVGGDEMPPLVPTPARSRGATRWDPSEFRKVAASALTGIVAATPQVSSGWTFSSRCRKLPVDESRRRAQSAACDSADPARDSATDRIRDAGTIPADLAAIVIPIVAIAAAAAASTVVMLAFAIPEIGMSGIQSKHALTSWIESKGSTASGMLVLVLPGQLAFLATTLCAAAFSPEPMIRRLGLARPVVPWWTLLLILPGGLSAGLLGDLLVNNIIGPDRGEHLKLIYGFFSNASGAYLAFVVVLISALPGFAEEILFRGYAQTRLLKRCPPAAAILTSAILFSIAHMDPAQSLGVLPLGIWFGVVAWLCRSIWPAIICHIANNALAVLVASAGKMDQTEHVKLDAGGLVLIAITD